MRVYGLDIVSVEYDFSGAEIAPDFLESARFMTAGLAIRDLKVPRAGLQEDGVDYVIALTGPDGPTTTIRLEKARGIVSVYRGDILVHGGRVGNQDTVIPSYPIRYLSESGGSVPLGRFNFPLAPDDAFYGLGDKSGEPNRRGRRFRMSNRDSLGYDAANSDPLYKSVPFFLKRNRSSGTICGLFFPAAWIEDVDFGRESPYYFKVEVKGGPFAYFVLLGESYRDVLGAYYRVVGFPALPPLFSFGFFGSSMNYVEGDDAADRIMRYFATVEEYRIPCEGMYVSSGYLKSPEGKRYAFLWNKKKFPNYESFLRSLAARGYNLCMNIKPGILASHPWYEEIARKGYLIADAAGIPYKEFFWGGEASFIDFSNPEANAWWKTQLHEHYLDHGCTGIWNDNNELELEDGELPAFRTRSLYPVKMAEAAYEAFKKKDPDIRPWVYSRSGYAGLQRYARTWTGDNVSDWKTLRYNQYMGVSLGLSGMPFYGHDLGGFFGDFPVEELLVRSSQSAVFQPRFVIHSWREDGRVTEPWSYPDSLDLIRGHIREHYRFMPYTYNCALEAARTGVPVERPLFLEFPGDPQIDDRDFNTLYGSSILKILVVDEGARSAIVHFPSPASWYDPAEHCLRPGGSTMEIQVPMEGARWFAMAGSVIPTSPGLESLKTGYFGLIEFLVFPPASGGEVACVYYEDDGKTELEPGRFNAWTVSASYDAEAGQGRIHISATQCSDVDPSADRLMRVALPPSFRFKEGTLPQATVGDLRESRGGEWEFEGGYIMSGKKEER